MSIPELGLLRERTALARRASVALADGVRRACADSAATRAAARQARERWQAWRAALSSLPPGPVPVGGRPMLLVCPGCGDICALGLVDGWAAPPPRAVERWRARVGERHLAAALCPRCGPPDDPVPPEAEVPDAAAVLLDVLADVHAAVDHVAAEQPWLDPDEAFDHGCRQVVARLDGAIAERELRALAAALAALSRDLRGAAPHQARGERFRPPLGG